jgi:hypothetical protein
MKKNDATLVLVILALVAAAAAGGYLYRRHTHPTLEEKMEDAGNDLRDAFKKATR